ncbi:hypothetical protein [Pseudarthrobacter sp. fls2-241-R2A-127]|uniref:hypothetical protein n=1 Tax=Pseudarthrobacter sp. fls2-241-R2A-127 TaxID=3040303 RepID=UPI0025549D45|nr:hypothetical protein [Pseudarthrobacter sp. fls2-241-R2A-127]
MSETPDVRQRLSTRIDEKQQALRAYLAKERPRRNRLSTISIIGSAVAALLTAGPAAGGSGFSNAVADIFSLGDDSVVWRVLCLLAMIFSVAAALATTFATSRAVADKVSAAETCAVQLAGLSVSLDIGRVDIDDAVKLYQQYTGLVSFVEDTASR